MLQSYTVSAVHQLGLYHCKTAPTSQTRAKKQRRPCHIDLSRVHSHVLGVFHSYMFVFVSVFMSVEWTVVSLGFVKTDRMCKLKHFMVAWRDNTVITLC